MAGVSAASRRGLLLDEVLYIMVQAVGDSSLLQRVDHPPGGSLVRRRRIELGVGLRWFVGRSRTRGHREGVAIRHRHWGGEGNESRLRRRDAGHDRGGG